VVRVASSVSVRMVVGFQLLFHITEFFLQFLDLFFECFDPLIVIWMMVTLLCFSHVASSESHMIVIQVRRPSETAPFSMLFMRVVRKGCANATASC
jgi:hypothetical protein